MTIEQYLLPRGAKSAASRILGLRASSITRLSPETREKIAALMRKKIVLRGRKTGPQPARQ